MRFGGVGRYGPQLGRPTHHAQWVCPPLLPILFWPTSKQHPHCVAYMFGSWFAGIYNNLKTHVLLGAYATCQSLWLYRNNVVFFIKISYIFTFAGYIYSLIHWFRTWAILQKPQAYFAGYGGCGMYKFGEGSQGVFYPGIWVNLVFKLVALNTP